jgi:hypothetical protein
VQTTDTYGTIVSRGRNQVGWAAGVGAEWAFLDNWSLGVEYLHADFGSYDIAFVDPVLTAAGDRRQNRLLPVSTDGADSWKKSKGSQDNVDIGPQAAPNASQSRIRIKDSIDMVRVKLNLRFDTASILGIR